LTEINFHPRSNYAMAAGRRRRLIFWLSILVLYVITWIGGVADHARELDADTRARYRRAADGEEAEWAFQRAMHGGGKTFSSALRPGGPISGVNWSVPILPGVLLVDSYYSLGPNYSQGHAKIVLYYGLGTVTVCKLWGWLT
jgi:hypothetical protein